MASYTYKYVRDLLPEWAKEGIEKYDGDANYDGDMWLAACDYILCLEGEVAKHVTTTNTHYDARLYDWLKSREKGVYNPEGPLVRL